jgi:hypothetical protein
MQQQFPGLKPLFLSRSFREPEGSRFHLTALARA